MNNLSDKELYELAKKRVAAKKAFNIHFGVYLIVSLMLVFLSVSNGSTWFIFPVLGWGIGILAHKMALNSFLNSKDDIENELNNLKK